MNHRLRAPHLAGLYLDAARRYGELPAFATRTGPEAWEPVSFDRLARRGWNLAAGLIGLEVGKQEPVGLFSDNRLEWILSDYAIQFSGAVTVPRGTDVTTEELKYIINHAGIRVAVVENSLLLDRIDAIREEVPNLEYVILMEEGERREFDVGLYSFSFLEQAGEKAGSDRHEELEDRVASLDPDQLFTIIYTSGTTGRPKGVMLTHKNMMSQMEGIPIDLTCTDRVLSILPVWHIFERVFEVYTICSGTCTYYSSVRTLGEDLKEVEPTFMGSAPRLWESLYQRILASVQEAHWMRQWLFNTAYWLASHYRRSLSVLRKQDLLQEKEESARRIARQAIHLVRWAILLPWYGFFNVAVLEPIRMSTGGSLKATVSGGGALPLEIDRFFNDVGIPVLEGYGMTETSPVIAVRTFDQLVVGTVGPWMPETEIRIVDPEDGTLVYSKEHPEGKGIRGEIQVRGPQVMKGYYKDPEETEAVLDEDGWLRTGDLGMVTWNDCLKILGRKKATVVLSSGENLEPEPIEMRVNQSPLVDHCMVVGQDQKQIALLVVPNLAACQEAGVDADSLDTLVDDPKTRELIREEVRTRVSAGFGFKPYERPRQIRLLTEPFEVGRELTSLFKLKRHVIESRYRELIDGIYRTGRGDQS
ncbi:MAG: AMP-dependent synthetase/ligase [Bacteroidota bacterium]